MHNKSILDKLKDMWESTGQRVDENTAYQEDPTQFYKSKQQQMSNIPQSDIQDYTKNVRDESNMWKTAQDVGTMSGGIKINPMQREARELFLKGGPEAWKNRIKELQANMGIDESGLSAMSEEALEKMNNLKRYLQERVGSYESLGQKAPVEQIPSSPMMQQYKPKKLLDTSKPADLLDVAEKSTEVVPTIYEEIAKRRSSK